MPDDKLKLETPQSLDPYFSVHYDSKGRFCSYWHQIDEVFQLDPKQILEIGTGTGFFRRYLIETGIEVISLDIANQLCPDVTGSVLAIPFRSESFEVVVCYEVLEHLYYDNFLNAMKELARVSSDHVVLSLPDISPVLRFQLEFPKLGLLRGLVPLPALSSKNHKFDGYHYWEIGKRGYPFSKIKADIERSGLKIRKTFRVFENYSHRFLILVKN